MTLRAKQDHRSWGAIVLAVSDVHVYFGGSYVLQGMNLSVHKGECVGLLGRNGVGKTTLLRTILGLARPQSGAVHFNSNGITHLEAHEIPRLGIGYVPQRDVVFPDLTVAENLEIGSAKSHIRDVDVTPLFALFPRLKERLQQRAGSLSGGERQMLAIARAMVGNPTLVLLDEPTSGLMPLIVMELMQVIKKISASGIAILLVEQNIRCALDVCDRIYVMERGHTKFECSVPEADETQIFHQFGL